MFPENIYFLRTVKRKSQKDIADYLKITRQAYSYYETGKRQPNYETLLKLSEYFNVTVDELLNEDISNRDENLVIISNCTKKMSPQIVKKLLCVALTIFDEFKEDFNTNKTAANGDKS